MKKMVLFLFLVCIPLVSGLSERATMQIDDSFLVQQKNITLLGLDDKDDKAVVCVNNKMSIIVDDQVKLINGLEVTLRKVDKEEADFKFYVDSDKNAECDDSCMNNECVLSSGEEEIEEEKSVIEIISGEGEVISRNGKVVGEEERDYGLIFSIVLVFVILLLFIVFIIRNIR